ncbi:MAG: universal stress protein, partial [Cyanobacteria bacterium J06642_3]
MIHKIIVALDHSSLGASVFNQALSQAINSKANLMLLHVMSPQEGSWG